MFRFTFNVNLGIQTLNNQDIHKDIAKINV